MRWGEVWDLCHEMRNESKGKELSCLVVAEQLNSCDCSSILAIARAIWLRWSSSRTAPHAKRRPQHIAHLQGQAFKQRNV